MNTPVLSSPQIEQFRTSIPLQTALKEELKLPGIAAALAAIASTTRPTSIPGSIPGNHPDTAIAHQFYRMFGVQQVLSTLEAMTVAPGKHLLEAPVGALPLFESNLPEQYQNPLPPDKRKDA